MSERNITQYYIDLRSIIYFYALMEIVVFQFVVRIKIFSARVIFRNASLVYLRNGRRRNLEALNPDDRSPTIMARDLP